MACLLSVIIPTHKRPRMLARAIDSALKSERGGNVQVVVVPNGPDDSWRDVARAFETDARVCWHYLACGNASAARNHGLRYAEGKYVRFLDDDDFLYAEAAQQLEEMVKRKVDVCSAPLENLTPDGRAISVFRLPDSSDVVTAALMSIAITGLTQGSIFRREVVGRVRWREDAELYDDYLWMLDVVVGRDLSWHKLVVPVGSYVQHEGLRLSRRRRTLVNSKQLVSAVIAVYDDLLARGALSPERSSAVATSLLTHAHSAFPACPVYLSLWIVRARQICFTATPLQPVFLRYPILGRALLLLEWGVLLPRTFSRARRSLMWLVGRYCSEWRDANKLKNRL